MQESQLTLILWVDSFRHNGFESWSDKGINALDNTNCTAQREGRGKSKEEGCVCVCV